MKLTLVLCLSFFSLQSYSQKKEKIDVPSRVAYKYCSAKKVLQAKDLLLSELVKNDPTYSLVDEAFIVGPVLWERLEEIEEFGDISGTRIKYHIDNAIMYGKQISDIDDATVLWDYIRSEFNGVPMRIRKLSYDELNFFWTVIDYDIVEPILLAELPEHKYIFDIDKKSLKITQLDEVPADLKEWYESIRQ